MLLHKKIRHLMEAVLSFSYLLIIIWGACIFPWCGGSLNISWPWKSSWMVKKVKSRLHNPVSWLPLVAWQVDEPRPWCLYTSLKTCEQLTTLTLFSFIPYIISVAAGLFITIVVLNKLKTTFCVKLETWITEQYVDYSTSSSLLGSEFSPELAFSLSLLPSS